MRFNSIEGWSLAVVYGGELIVTTMGIYLEVSGDASTAVLSANLSNINSSMPVYWNVPSSYVNMNWVSGFIKRTRILTCPFLPSCLLMGPTL